MEVRIDSLAFGGAGVGRLDGYVVFVHGAVPGDTVRARITKPKRAYAEARAVELLEPSAERIEPRAPHPGAPWQVLPYGRQLTEKRAQVAEALERLGGFPQPPVSEAVPAAAQWRYRNKLEYSFGESPNGELVLGFHRAGRWDEIDEIADDVLASERVNAARDRVADWCRAQGLPAYDRTTHRGFLRNLVLREGRRTGQLQARLVTAPGDFPAGEFALHAGAQSVLWTRSHGVAESSRGGQTVVLTGGDRIDEGIEFGGQRLSVQVSWGAFFQTNTETAEHLYATVAELAGLTGAERVFDLFCGIGAIALTLASSSGEVWGVEVEEEAVADAIQNAELNGIDNARFFAGDVRTAMRPLVEEAGRPDVVVLDPPRAGLSQKIVRRVLEAEPTRIVYVSCNPSTLAPNARQIADAAYRLSAVVPVDMFPQTPHIECVALLERTSEA